jgi:hypothetical protein
MGNEIRFGGSGDAGPATRVHPVPRNSSLPRLGRGSTRPRSRLKLQCLIEPAARRNVRAVASRRFPAGSLQPTGIPRIHRQSRDRLYDLSGLRESFVSRDSLSGTSGKGRRRWIFLSFGRFAGKSSCLTMTSPGDSRRNSPAAPGGFSGFFSFCLSDMVTASFWRHNSILPFTPKNSIARRRG